MARLLRESGFDPQACYRVHDLEIDREDLRIYLTAGHLLLAREIGGIRPAALFTADVEAGDAEILLIPPNRSERLSLAAFTGAPNFNEHFHSTLLIFTDDTGASLQRHIAEQEEQEALSWKDPVRGAELAQQWDTALRNVYSSFDLRLVQRLVSPGAKGFIFGTFAGGKHQNFDVEYDYTPTPRIIMGQLIDRPGGAWFDTWTSFAARSARQAGKSAPQQPVTMSDYRIDASLDDRLTVSAVTRVKVTVQPGNERAVPFFIAGGMHVESAKIDGQPAEIFESASLRSTLMRGGPDAMFLVIPPAALEAGRTYEFEFHHRGDVISPSGNGVYFVGGRGSWYPHQELEFATYDISYTWPATLDLVSTGDLLESKTIGDRKTARFRTSSPARLAGFNLGTYDRRVLERGGYHIEVCANTSLEPAIKASQSAPRLDAVAEEVASALAFMTARFGAPPVKSVTVAPIPGSFGQGFPGLIYLSTLTYVNAADRPAGLRDKFMDMLFSDLLVAHETAHQWWGNLVAPTSFEDQWISEALANYSALLFLAETRGPETLRTTLDEYRRDLLAMVPSGHTVESAGPITWGTRLSSSQTPDAWRIVTYEKGSWIIHMLRNRLGDENFDKFLREICRRYRFQPMSTEDFRQLAAQFLPPNSPDPRLESFFDTWVYGTGIPALKLNYTVSGARISGTIEQSGVPADFGAWVPVAIYTSQSRPEIHWVETGSDPVSFSWSMKEKPLRAALQPADALVTIQ